MHNSLLAIFRRHSASPRHRRGMFDILCLIGREKKIVTFTACSLLGALSAPDLTLREHPCDVPASCPPPYFQRDLCAAYSTPMHDFVQSTVSHLVIVSSHTSHSTVCVCHRPSSSRVHYFVPFVFTLAHLFFVHFRRQTNFSCIVVAISFRFDHEITDTRKIAEKHKAETINREICFPRLQSVR